MNHWLTAPVLIPLLGGILQAFMGYAPISLRRTLAQDHHAVGYLRQHHAPGRAVCSGSAKHLAIDPSGTG